MLKKIIPFVLAILMLAGAAGHVLAPEFYEAMVPPFIPFTLANLLATVIEIVIGVVLLIPGYRRWGGLGFSLLMVAFLPLHIWDVVREDPVVGSQIGAIIRLLLQLVLIYAGWWVYKK